MKALLLIILLLISVSAMGQVKKDKPIFTPIFKMDSNYHTFAIQPQPKPWLIINNAFNNPDSVVLVMHNRKQAYWLNDSTLVIKKP